MGSAKGCHCGADTDTCGPGPLPGRSGCPAAGSAPADTSAAELPCLRSWPLVASTQGRREVGYKTAWPEAGWPGLPGLDFSLTSSSAPPAFSHFSHTCPSMSQTRCLCPPAADHVSNVLFLKNKHCTEEQINKAVEVHWVCQAPTAYLFCVTMCRVPQGASALGVWVWTFSFLFLSGRRSVLFTDVHLPEPDFLF